jgi:hypothetical protein
MFRSAKTLHHQAAITIFSKKGKTQKHESSPSPGPSKTGLTGRHGTSDSCLVVPGFNSRSTDRIPARYFSPFLLIRRTAFFWGFTQLSGNLLPTFRANPSVPSSGDKNPKKAYLPPTNQRAEGGDLRESASRRPSFCLAISCVTRISGLGKTILKV